jgi:hypothetical protein
LGKRVFAKTPGNGTTVATACEIYFYAGGQKLVTFQCGYNDQTGGNGQFWYQVKSRNVYFGGKLMRSAGVTAVTDRLGSVRANSNGERVSYFPYGEERTSTADGRAKFGTYFRDPAANRGTGLCGPAILRQYERQILDGGPVYGDRLVNTNRLLPGWSAMKIAVGLGLLCAILAAAPPDTISVCEAARYGDQLDGRIVRVRGVWRQAFPQLAIFDIFDEIVDAECPEIEVQVVSNGTSLPRPPPGDYKVDLRSVRKARRVAEKASANGRNVFATIVGVMYVVKKEDYVTARPLGTGIIIPPHHKWYPLVLLVESVPRIQEQPGTRAGKSGGDR